MLKKWGKRLLKPLWRISGTFVRRAYHTGPLPPARVITHDGVLQVAFDFVYRNGITGDYLEFGVYKGRSFRSAWNYGRSRLPNGHYYLFDSFEGLPEPGGVDSGDIFYAGKYSCGLSDFLKSADESRIPRSAYTCIKGFYEDTLNEELHQRLPLGKAAVVYVDCDLYESTRLVLNWIRPYLQPGTVIAFDDYFCFKGDPTKGEQRAIREFLETAGDVKLIDYYLFGWHGKSFIVHLEQQPN